MIRQYNRHVDEARGIIYRMGHGSAAKRKASSDQFANDYPNIRRKLGGGWEVSGQGLCGNIVTRDLKYLTRAEAPGLSIRAAVRYWSIGQWRRSHDGRSYA